MSDCVLCQIVSGELLHADDLVVCIDRPQDHPVRLAPVHFLVVPREPAAIFAKHSSSGCDMCEAAGRPRERAMAETKHGFLVLADISGFTAFVTTTELEHGPPIIAELLEEVIRRISPPLEIEAVEGDALFARGVHGAVLPPAGLLDVLQAGFAGFRERQRALEADDSCSCNACRSVGKLRLKAIGHYGTFLEQTVGGRTQTAGPDVILAHRLLKNGVAEKDGYALLTRPAIEYMDLDPGRLGLLPHTERYEHFGEVECFVGNLAGVPPR